MNAQLDKPRRTRIDWTLWGTLALLAIGYIFIHDLLGQTLLAHSDWDSYTLQALAWREGRLDLGQNYPWLELAIYNGSYYVSFPPVPSLVMLPLTFFFGGDTPNNLMVALYALICVALAYKTLARVGLSSLSSAFWSVFLVMGSNLLWMSTNGGVWFQAQALNMLFCLACVLAALCGHRGVALAMLSLAVGCRPFSAVYFPALIFCFYREDRAAFPDMGRIKTLLSQWKTLIFPAAVAAALMAYNYARFGNALEFGHNYLPEFVQSQNGQFNLSYLPQNLYNIFLRPLSLNGDLGLVYERFDGFMFFVANPLFIVFFAYLLRDIAKKRMDAQKAAVCAAMAVNLLLLAAHKTFGGWQFGARYTVDLLPFAFLFLILSGLKKPRGWELFIGAFALMLNLYGALAMTFTA